MATDGQGSEKQFGPRWRQHNQKDSRDWTSQKLDQDDKGWPYTDTKPGNAQHRLSDQHAPQISSIRVIDWGEVCFLVLDLGNK